LTTSEKELVVRAAGGRPRVVLADDHAAMLEKASGLLESNFEIVAAVGDGAAAVRAITELLPEVAVLDVGMPVLNGLEAVRLLRNAGITVKIVFLTIQDDGDYVDAARELGASYVLKALMGSELIPAIDETLIGGCWISSLRGANQPASAEHVLPG
jgi:DNA-binding NarL/FixJ family response regulator